MSKSIVITRARGDETELSNALKECGFHVIHEPMTEIFLLHTARPALEELLAQDPDAVILTSRHGARALASLSALRDMPLLCVGETTADTAQSLGFNRVSACGGDVEALQRYVHDAYDEGARFAYVSAEHIRREMTVEGMEIARVIAYEARAVEQFSDVLVEQLKRGHMDAATFMSARAAEIFCTLAERAQLAGAIEPLQAFALSDAIAKMLNRLSWKAVYAAPKPTLASLIQCIDNGMA